MATTGNRATPAPSQEFLDTRAHYEHLSNILNQIEKMKESREFMAKVRTISLSIANPGPKLSEQGIEATTRTSHFYGNLSSVNGPVLVAPYEDYATPEAFVQSQTTLDMQVMAQAIVTMIQRLDNEIANAEDQFVLQADKQVL